MQNKNQQTKGLLSIARKGNFAVIGLDNIKKLKRKYPLILLCTSAGENLKKEANFFRGKFEANLIEVDDLADLIQIGNCKIVLVNNLGIANSLKNILEVKFDN